MHILYTSTLCMSSHRHASCSQILPILEKLEDHFRIQEEDSQLMATIKDKFWGDLSKCYQMQKKQTLHNLYSYKAGCYFPNDKIYPYCEVIL